MNRHVEGADTTYRYPWVDTMQGERLRMELVAAGIESEVHYDPAAGELCVVVADEKGKKEAKVAKAVKDHEGTKAKDHIALLAFAAAIRDAAKRMAEGGKVTQEERDIVTGVLVSRLV